jgi:peptide/nickel transport system substrate-binding protein
MGFNTRPDGVEHKEYFTDKRVRRAVAMLISVDEINDVLNKGKSQRQVGPVSPLKKAYHDGLPLIQRDVIGAKKLLEEAGWTDTDGDNILDKVIDGEKTSFEFDLHYMTTTVTWKDEAGMIAEYLYEAGLKCNIVPMDFAVLYDRAKNHKFDAMLAAWGGNATPSDYTQLWHTGSWASKGSNFPGFGNADSDALIDSIKYTIDDTKRIPMIKRLQETIYEEQPYVFLFSATRRNVIHKRFGNADMYFERPGVLINNFKLLSGGSITTPSADS